MQANRAVLVDEAPWPEPIPAREVVRIAKPSTGHVAASPALLLRAELEARITGVGSSTLAEPELAKWPMAARLAVIVGGSLAAWTAIGLALIRTL